MGRLRFHIWICKSAPPKQTNRCFTLTWGEQQCLLLSLIRHKSYEAGHCECLRGLSDRLNIFLTEQLHQTRADVWYGAQWQCEIAGFPVLMCLLATSLRKGKPIRWWMAECLIWLRLLPLFPLSTKKNSSKAPHLLWASQCFDNHVPASTFSLFIIKFYKAILTCEFW